MTLLSLKPAPIVTIPKGANFTNMLALCGKSDIVDKLNIQVIMPLAQANARFAHGDFQSFNDSNKLGEGQARPSTDPTCGSGLLLLKVTHRRANTSHLKDRVDGTTDGRDRMDMILHDFPTTNVVSGNKLAKIARKSPTLFLSAA